MFDMKFSGNFKNKFALRIIEVLTFSISAYLTISLFIFLLGETTSLFVPIVCAVVVDTVKGFTFYSLLRMKKIGYKTLSVGFIFVSILFVGAMFFSLIASAGYILQNISADDYMAANKSGLIVSYEDEIKIKQDKINNLKANTMMYKEDYKNGKIEQKDYLLQEKLNLNNIEKINKEISELKNKKDVYMTTLETNSQLDIKKGNNVFVKLSEGFNSLGLNTSSEGIRIFLLALFSFIIECGFLFTMYIDIIGKKKLFGEKEPDSTMNENNPLLSKLPAENIKPRIIQESRRKESTVRVSQITDKELFLKFVIDLYNGEDKPAKLQSDNDMRDKGFPARMVREYKMLMKDIVIKDPITGIKKSIIKVNAGWMGIEPLVSLSELTDFIKDDSFSLDIKDGKLIAYPTSSYPLNGNDSPVNNSESDYLPDGTKNNPEIARYFPGIKDRVLKN